MADPVEATCSWRRRAKVIAIIVTGAAPGRFAREGLDFIFLEVSSPIVNIALHPHIQQIL
jgi:hypothetical protein